VSTAPLGARAAALRRAFDQSFSAPPAAVAAAREDLLAIRAGGEAYALRLAELAGVAAGRRITPLPTAVAGLRGLVGLRGRLVPVWDLAALLGHPAPEAPRWLALVGGERSLGLAFEGFDGYLRVAREAIAPDPAAPSVHGGDSARERALVREVVRLDAAVRPLVHLPAVVAAIETRARQAGAVSRTAPQEPRRPREA
jgi:purine-binding chemotaxis protein CheW